MDDQDACAILGVSRDASLKEIKRAFRREALSLHPDKSTSSDATAEFIRLKQAYDDALDRRGRCDDVDDAPDMDQFIDTLMRAISRALARRSHTGQLMLEMPVSLSELHDGAAKRLTVRVRSSGGIVSRDLYVGLLGVRPPKTVVFQGQGDDGGDVRVRVVLEVSDRDAWRLVRPDDVYLDLCDVYIRELYEGCARTIPSLSGEYISEFRARSISKGNPRRRSRSRRRSSAR
jgi:hypothetical protein